MIWFHFLFCVSLVICIYILFFAHVAGYGVQKSTDKCDAMTLPWLLPMPFMDMTYDCWALVKPSKKPDWYLNSSEWTYLTEVYKNYLCRHRRIWLLPCCGLAPAPAHTRLGLALPDPVWCLALTPNHSVIPDRLSLTPQQLYSPRCVARFLLSCLCLFLAPRAARSPLRLLVC